MLERSKITSGEGLAAAAIYVEGRLPSADDKRRAIEALLLHFFSVDGMALRRPRQPRPEIPSHQTQRNSRSYPHLHAPLWLRLRNRFMSDFVLIGRFSEQVGFRMIDAFAESLGVPMETVHCKALFGKCTFDSFRRKDFGLVGDVPVFLAKPQTYMNLSGESMFDDMNLPCGVLRLHEGGGHGGHNGLKNVIHHFRGNRDFARLRIGIGRPPGQMDPKAFMLQNFNATANEKIVAALQEGVGVLKQLISKGFMESARCFNTQQKYKHVRKQCSLLGQSGQSDLISEGLIVLHVPRWMRWVLRFGWPPIGHKISNYRNLGVGFGRTRILKSISFFIAESNFQDEFGLEYVGPIICGGRRVHLEGDRRFGQLCGPGCRRRMSRLVNGVMFLDGEARPEKPISWIIWYYDQ
ncbi:hypothetical protein ACLOJK_021094 [Asimina triloba]